MRSLAVATPNRPKKADIRRGEAIAQLFLAWRNDSSDGALREAHAAVNPALNPHEFSWTDFDPIGIRHTR